MKISNSERLSLLILSEIHQQLNINHGEINTQLISDAIIYDQTWAIDWEYSMLFGERVDPTPDKVSWTVDVLDMWDLIENSYQQLDAKQQATMLNKLPSYVGKNPMFRGFDGNQEGEYYAIIRFLVHHMGRFEWLKERNLNTHMPMSARYNHMLMTFKPIRRTLSIETTLHLSLDQLETVLKEY